MLVGSEGRGAEPGADDACGASVVSGARDEQVAHVSPGEDRLGDRGPEREDARLRRGSLVSYVADHLPIVSAPGRGRAARWRPFHPSALMA